MNEADALSRLEAQLAELALAPEADIRTAIDLRNALAWQLSDIDPKHAYVLGEEAYALASACGDGGAPHHIGIAYSLRTLGYLNQRLGNHPLGLSQLLKALEICEGHAIDDALTDVLDGIAGIYFQIGDYPTSLDYMHRQLAAAQYIDDKRRIANALNNLGNIYWEMGDLARAQETFQSNLQMADAIGFDRIRTLSLLNLAGTYCQTGHSEVAREYILEGLRISREAGFPIFELHAYEIGSRIYLQLGNLATALAYLDKALALSRAQDSKVTETQILLTLGQAYLTTHQHGLALDALRQGLAIATAIGAQSELAAAHLRLAETFEQAGDAVQALAHFKEHQAAKELVAGEKAEKRLQVLQIAHDTATARQDAELARLRTVELSTLNERLEAQVASRTAELTATVALLQQEIAVRERAEGEIRRLVDTLEQSVADRTDELAAFFDLVLLAGQATDLSDVFEQVLARIMETTHSRALCIHLFDAERTALHLAGQQQLSDATNAALLDVPLHAELAQWLRQPHDPLVTTDLPSLALLPGAFRTPEYRTYLGAQIKIGGRIEGLLSCYRFTDRGFNIDEIALVTALAEQLGMMLEMQRLRQHGEAMAVLEERQRLARDLHDSVTQSLYSLSLFSRAGREAAEDGDAARLRFSLAEMERNTLHALREMRLLLYALRPADLEQEGLMRAIQLRLNSVERRVGLQLDVHLDDLPPIPPGSEHELYHIIVEALNNVVKHAAATRLGVDLAARDGALHLRIVDDGRGFDPGQQMGGLGLRNIQERVARLHGRLEIASAPGHGTRLEATIPNMGRAQ